MFTNRSPLPGSCDVRLPAEPLEVRLTFCGNSDSEIALVLLLDVQGQLGGRREVVLRDWGQEVRGNGPTFGAILANRCRGSIA